MRPSILVRRHLKADRKRAKKNHECVRRAFIGTDGLSWYCVEPDGNVTKNTEPYNQGRRK